MPNVRFKTLALVLTFLLILLLTGCPTPKHNLTVDVSPEGSGTVEKSPDKTEYEEGSTVDLTAIGNIGYLFDLWEGDASGSNESISITMSSDKSVTAVFKEGVYEDFNDGVADNFETDYSGRWSVSNNEYRMDGVGDNTTAYSYYPYEFTDFTFSVDVKQMRGYQGHAFGIYFKSQSADPKNNSYRLSISSNGNWYIGMYLSGDFYWLTDGWVYSSVLNEGLTATNNIEIVFSGSIITLYFNGVKEATVTKATTWASGYSGILGYDGYESTDPDNVFVFDNFSVSTSNGTRPAASLESGKCLSADLNNIKKKEDINPNSDLQQ